MTEPLPLRLFLRACSVVYYGMIVIGAAVLYVMGGEARESLEKEMKR